MFDSKRIGNYASVMEAEMARALLRASGIEASVQSEHMSSMLPYLSLGGVGLVVNAADEAEALEILHFTDEAPPEG